MRKVSSLPPMLEAKRNLKGNWICRSSKIPESTLTLKILTYRYLILQEEKGICSILFNRQPITVYSFSSILCRKPFHTIYSPSEMIHFLHLFGAIKILIKGTLLLSF